MNINERWVLYRLLKAYVGVLLSGDCGFGGDPEDEPEVKAARDLLGDTSGLEEEERRVHFLAEVEKLEKAHGFALVGMEDGGLDAVAQPGEEERRRRLAIYGPGGAGKSMLALDQPQPPSSADEDPF
jgi:hypothetical protein